jgi:hypothetical protein
MYKIYLFCLMILSNVAVGQLSTNYTTRQTLLESYVNMEVYGNNMFLSKSQADEIKVYTRQENGEWTFLQTLKPSDKPLEAPYWRFGENMAINDSNAVIGATEKNLMKDKAGGVYFFRKGLDGLWYEEFVFENPTLFSYYAGKNIAVYKNKATVSHNNGYPRFVHIFERKHDGTWAIGDTITEPEFRGIDGVKVFFRDSVFIAMSFQFDDQRVKEFRLQSDGTWTNTQTLTTGITTYSTYFGQRLVVEGEQMIVGAGSTRVSVEGETELNGAGKVYVYERINNEWVLKQEILSATPQAYENFGGDIVLKDGLLLITSSGTINEDGKGYGAIHIYKKDNNNTWSLVQTYTPSNAQKVFYENAQIISGVYILEEIEDCAGVVGGTAALNSCDICYGGTTGLSLEVSETQCLLSSAIDLHLPSGIVVAPNPFGDEILLQAPGNALFSLADCYGKILKKDIAAGRFDASTLSAGMYFMTAEYEGERYVFKLLKQ